MVATGDLVEPARLREFLAGHLDGSPPDAADLAERIRRTRTAEWLREMGFEHEVEALCEFDSTDVVPRLRDGAFVAE
jgi:hypothetical protein